MMQLDENPDDVLCKNDRCCDRLNSVTPKEGPSDRQYEDTTLQCLPPEYDRICRTHFEREDCNLKDIRRMSSKIYAHILARSNSDSSRGITERGLAMKATRRDLRNIYWYYCNKFGQYENDCADFKAVRQQNQRRRQRQDKQRGGHQPHQPKPGGSNSRGEERKYGAHTTRPQLTTTPIAPPGRQTGSMAMPTSPKSVLQVFLGSIARGIFLREMTPTRSPASQS